MLDRQAADNQTNRSIARFLDEAEEIYPELPKLIKKAFINAFHGLKDDLILLSEKEGKPLEKDLSGKT